MSRPRRAWRSPTCPITGGIGLTLYHRAPTLAALGRSAGLPGQALAALAADPRGALVSAPFYALGPLESRIVITDGGLAVNGSHQVLGTADRIIPRLYAAGAVGQGGALLAGNGHHIGWAVTSGRRAGRFAAQGLSPEAVSSADKVCPGAERAAEGVSTVAG